MKCVGIVGVPVLPLPLPEPGRIFEGYTPGYTKGVCKTVRDNLSKTLEADLFEETACGQIYRPPSIACLDEFMKNVYSGVEVQAVSQETFAAERNKVLCMSSFYDAMLAIGPGSHTVSILHVSDEPVLSYQRRHFTLTSSTGASTRRRIMGATVPFEHAEYADINHVAISLADLFDPHLPTISDTLCALLSDMQPRHLSIYGFSYEGYTPRHVDFIVRAVHAAMRATAKTTRE